MNAVAFLLGVPILILTRCLSPEEAYESVDWRLMVLIGSMMAFGVAMSKTGAADWLAAHVVSLTSGWGPFAVMVAFFLLTLILTQPMSNQAAALVVLPVAIKASATLGVDARPMVMAVAFAASCSFLTPLERALLRRGGKHRVPIFITFAPAHNDLIGGEINIFDSELQTLHQSQAGAVKKHRHEPVGMIEDAED